MIIAIRTYGFYEHGETVIGIFSYSNAYLYTRNST